MALSSSSGESYCSLSLFVGFEVIRDQMIVMIPGQMEDFARSYNFNSSEQRTWSIFPYCWRAL